MNKTIGIIVIFLFIAVAIPTVNADWFGGYAYKMEINCTNMTDRLPLIVNGSNGFQVDGETQYIYTYCSGKGTAVYYNGKSDVIVANNSEQLPSCSENSSASSHDCNLVFGTDAAQTNIAAFGLTNLSDWREDHDLDNDGAVLNETGKVAGGYQFNETDLLNLSGAAADLVFSNQMFTVFGWIATEGDEYCSIVNKPSVCANCNQRWRLGIDGSEHLDFFIDGSDGVGDQCRAQGTTDIVDGNFYFIAGVLRSDNSIDLYVNGHQEDTDINCPADSDGNTEPVRIGAEMTEGGAISYYFNGTIDNLIIMNRSYSDIEINQTYNNMINKTTFGTLEARESNYTVTIDSLTNNTLYNTSLINLSYTVVSVGKTIDKCWYKHNNTLTNLTSCANTTLENMASIEHNITVYSNATDGTNNNASVSFNIQQIEIRFNNSLTNTAINDFSIAWERGGSSITTTGVLYENLSLMNTSTYFTISASGFQSRRIDRSITEAFNASYNTSSAGIFIKTYDEDTLNNITSFNVSVYTITQTYDFEVSNLTVNETSFIINPDNTSYGSETVKIESGSYYYREYKITNDNNTANTVNAYLLPTTLASSILFSVIADTGVYLEGVDVDVEKIINGTYTIVAEGSTDSSGAISFYLDPSVFYRFTFSKADHTTKTTIIRPIQAQYQITLDTIIDTGYNNTWDGITMFIYPLKELFGRNETISFIFNITDLYGTLTGYSLNITNQTTSIYYGNDSNTIGGVLNFSIWNLNPYINQTINLTATFSRPGYSDGVLRRSYRVYNYASGNYTLWDGLTLLASGDDLDRSVATILAIIVIAIMMTGVGFLAGSTGSGIVGLIGMIFVWYIGLLPWELLGFISILIISILVLKERF